MSRDHDSLETPEAALACRGLTVDLPHPRHPLRPATPVLENIDLDVPAGRVTALVGSNGAGKTTLLRALMGSLRPLAGTWRALGRDLGPAHCPPPPGMQLVPDVPAFPADWDGDDVAVLHRRLRDGFDVRGFGSALRRRGIDPATRISSFSAGEATWFSFAHALACSPRLLLLDEPLARLDPQARAEMLDEIRDLVADGEDRSVLLSTHDLEGMERLVDHLVVLHAGRIILSGDVDVLLEGSMIATVPSAGGTIRGASGAERLQGPRAVGPGAGAVEGLVPAEDAVGLPAGTDLRVPSLQELVRFTLAAQTSRTKEHS